ncbi:hypothetical protein G6F65_011494 [Rhizopus arrhizus]|nr:hypothetical protein G6F65_011494 [Rhizopus arrhizus]
MAGRAVVLRIEPPAASRPCRASIVPSLRSADASGPASSFGPARLRLPCGRRGSPLPCAIKARRAVSSAAPAGRTNPALVSLTAPVRALLWPRAMNSGKTVATRPTGFLVPTAPNSRKAGLRI